MGRHAKREPDTTSTRPEPVAYAGAIQAVLAALVTLGWVNFDDQTQALIATALGAVLSIVTTVIARSKVTPVSDPRIEE